MKKSYKKSLTLLVSILVLVCVTVGGTLAYLITQTNALTNTFTPSEVTVEVNETFNGTTKSNVSIKNTGDTTAYIRAAVVVTWQDASGNVYGQAPVAGENGDYTIIYNTKPQNDPAGQWVLASDGFYYWSNPVEAGENTGILIEKAELNANVQAPADGYYLCIEIIGSGIQSEYDGTGDHPAKQAWGVTVANDGTISKQGG